MRIIAIVNQKGGSGKTTTTVSLGACLAETGRRVLLVDLDPQYSTTSWISAGVVGKGVFDLFAESEKCHLDDLVQPTGTENLFLVGSSVWLIGAEKALSREAGADNILKLKMADLKTRFDYILMDCPPNLGVLTVNALTAATEVLVPVECHLMGLQGLAQISHSVEIVKRRLNPGIHISGIVACRLDQRTNHGPEVVSTLREKFPETFRTCIRENIRLAECPGMSAPITAYAPNSSGTEDYRALAKEVIEQEGGSHAKAANE